MQKIALIGLGVMGLPMASNLVKAGFEVTGYSRGVTRVDAFRNMGGRGAGSVADAVRDADVIITVLPDSPDVEAVLTQEDGVLTHAKPGALWIDASSIQPATAVRLAQLAARKGIRSVDAPVSGSEQGAVDATLSIMVGGDAADVEAARPFLEKIGKSVLHVGPAGSGQTVKAANQLIVAGTIQLVAEAIVFLEAHNVAIDPALTVLSRGLAGNRILDTKAGAMVRRDFTPGFRVDLHHKDLGIFTDAARQAGVAHPAGAVAAQTMAALRAQGYGALDHTALLILEQQLSGRGSD
jgi:2-hydroxy-3-oxopropionate reductase